MAGSRSTYASGLDFANFEVWLYDYYKKNNMLRALLYKKDPFYALLRTRQATKVHGKQIIENIKYARNPNTGKQFNIAQKHARNQTSNRATFTYKLDKDFGVIRISNEIIYACRGDLGAFVDAYQDESTDILDALAERRIDDIWGNGSGARGAVESIAAKVITLSDPSALTNLDKGDKIEIWAPTANTQRVQGANKVFTISSVARDQDTPKLTLVETAPTAVAKGDLIFKEGDRGEITMEGIRSILPSTAPTANDDVFGFDRSVAPERLSGVRGTMTSSQTYSDFFRKLATECSMVTGKVPDTVWLNPLRLNSFIDELGDKVRYNDQDQMSAGNVGFSGVRVITPFGGMKVMSSLKVSTDEAFGINMDSFDLQYISAPGRDFVDFMPVGGDGKKLVSYDDAGIEVRVESYGALTCSAPGCNFVADLSSKSL